MAEKECIEREAAIAVIEEKQKELCPVGMYSRHAVYGSDREKFDEWQEIIDTLESIPAADVRPVVLCRDCKHNMANIPDIHDGININENWNACQLTELYDSVKPDDFCSHGKRKEIGI